MTNVGMKAKVNSLMAQRLSIQQILSAFVVVIPMLVGGITYVDGRYQTKKDSEALFFAVDKRVGTLESSYAENQKVQGQIYGEVKEISGYLRAKSEKK